MAGQGLDLGVGITQFGQVRGTRPGVQLRQQAVIARAGLGLGYSALLVVDVAEDDGPAGTDGLARGHDLVAPDGAILNLSGDPHLVDPLDAVSALLHHPSWPHGHVGVPHQLQAGRVLVGILEEVEPTHLVRAIVRAISRPHATVVRHLVEPLGAVRRRPHRADDLARGLFTVHAGHRLEVYRGIFCALAFEVTIDADPLHFARGEHLVATDDRDVVLGLASGDTGPAAGTGVEVDRHAPGVAHPLFVALLWGRIVEEARPAPPVLLVHLGEIVGLVVGREAGDSNRLATLHPMVVLSGRQAVLPARLDHLEPGAEPRFVRRP